MKAKRIVFFLQGRNVPASRFRGFAVADAFRQRGLDVSLRAPIPSVYGDFASVGRSRRLRNLLSPLAALSRVIQTANLRTDDFVFLQRPMLELPTTFFERAAVKNRGCLFDFDDAIYLNRATRTKFLRIVDMVDWVVAGNQTLAEAVGAPGKTRIIPTAVDTSRWTVQETRESTGRQVVVGWTGLSSNYWHLATALGPIGRALDRTGARLLLISDAPPPAIFDRLRPEFVRWRAESEVQDLARLDIGVMPLPDEPYERGKCAFKLIQYMSLARPALASPVGANKEVVEDRVSGILPRTDREWEDGLTALIQDPGLRRSMGARARARVVASYSLDAVVPAYLSLLGEARAVPQPSLARVISPSAAPGWVPPGSDGKKL